MTLAFKPVIGLIGAIGAGKSAVAEAMARHGAAVIDADRIGHAVLERPDVTAALVERWGSRVLKPDGTPDRRAIAGIVFADQTELRALEAIVFPHIGRRAAADIAAAQADPTVRFIVVDAAVMLEAGWDHECDRIVYVDAPREQRLARLAARSGWTADDLTAREAAQLPADEKRSHADAVLMNDGERIDLERCVCDFLREWKLIRD